MTVPTPDSGSIAERYDGASAFPVEQFLEESNFAPTCGLLVRRTVIDNVGAFDARLVSGGDREFGARVQAAGWKQGFAPDAPITHPARTSTRALLKKAYRVGRGTAQLKRYYPERYGNPLLTLVNPKPFVPDSFADVRSAVPGWDRYSLPEKAGCYLLHYGTSVARGYGQFSETLRGSRRGEIPKEHPLA